MESALMDTTNIAHLSPAQLSGLLGQIGNTPARYLQTHPALKNVVCLCPDGGENYASSIFNDQWLLQHDIVLSPAGCTAKVRSLGQMTLAWHPGVNAVVSMLNWETS